MKSYYFNIQPMGGREGCGASNQYLTLSRDFNNIELNFRGDTPLAIWLLPSFKPDVSHALLHNVVYDLPHAKVL